MAVKTKPKKEKMSAKPVKKEPLKAKKQELVKETSPWDIIIYPHLTEKSMNKVDLENKMVFIVNPNSTKPEIKKAVEEIFNVKVLGVTTEITMSGEKKAHVKLHENYSAADIASRLGVM